MLDATFLARDPLARRLRSSGYIDESGNVLPYGGGSVQVVNVADFGAVGDGVTDDSAAIQAAIDSVDDYATDRWNRADIYLPGGTYLLTRPLQIKTGEVSLIGAGRGGTRVTGSGLGPLVAIYPGTDDFPGAGYDIFMLVENYLTSSLVTGTGNGLSISPRAETLGAETLWRHHWFNWMDGLGAARVDGLAGFCIELTVQLASYNKVDPNNGQTTGTTGQFLGCAGKRFTSDTQARCFLLSHVNGVPRAELTVSGTRYTLTGVSTMSLATAHHLALSFDGTTIRLWLNGVLEASQAAAGTLTQAIHEFIQIGRVNTAFPELMQDSHAADAVIDAVRLSNVARYTSGFAKPTTKWTLDANALFVMNFDEQFDAFTVARTNFGDAYLFMRDDVLPGFVAKVRVADMTLDGAFSGSGYRAGILTIGAIEHHFERNDIYSNTWCVYHVRDGFLGRTNNNKMLAVSSWAPFCLGMSAACGVYCSTADEFTGGAYLLVLQNSSVTLLAPWLETGGGVSRAAILADGWGGIAAGVTLVGGVVNSESGGAYLEAGLLIGKAEFHMFGGAVEVLKTGIPATLFEGSTGVSFMGTAFHVNTGVSALIGVGEAPVGPITVVGAHKQASNDVPWTDAPEYVTFLNTPDNSTTRPFAQSRQIVPLVEATVTVSPSAGVVQLDASAANKFLIQVTDASAFTVQRPTGMSRGQELSIAVENASGGAMGAVTWSSTFNMSAWTNPADGYLRAVNFVYTGLQCREISRTPADVPVAATIPTDLANCVLWLDADDLGLADNDPVPTWSDLSGNGNHVAQATGASQPTFKTNRLNGKPAVRFDGTDDYLSALSSASLDITSEWSIFAVVNVHTAPGGDNYDLVRKLRSAGIFDVQYRYFISPARFHFVAQHDGTRQLEAGDDRTLDVGTFFLTAGVSRTAGLELFKNGAAHSNNPMVDGTWSYWAPVGTGSGPIYIGGVPGATSYSKVELAELVIYDRDLADDERAELEYYFASKYGLIIGS